MIQILLDGILCIIFILSFVFLVMGDINHFIWWLKLQKQKKHMDMHSFSATFWPNEWGQECTAEEIKELHKILRKYENEASKK